MPEALTEIGKLGRTVKCRPADVLAYLDLTGTRGPTEAINGGLEPLHGSAIGFRNLTHYVAPIAARDQRIQIPPIPSTANRDQTRLRRPHVQRHNGCALKGKGDPDEKGDARTCRSALDPSRRHLGRPGPSGASCAL